MNYSEQVAQRILKSVYPDATLTYRIQQSNGEYDVHLQKQDGTCAAIEITSSVDQTLITTVAAIRGRRAGGSSIAAVKCSKSWIIFPAPGADIPEIRRRIDDLLFQLEADGIENFDWIAPRFRGHPICAELGITFASAIDGSPSTPVHLIAFPISGGAVGPSTATSAAEREAWKDDNRAKLGAATTDERHLIVYVDAMNLPFTALTEFAPPATLPNLPDEITHLWLFAQTDQNTFIVWRASTTNPWCKETLLC